MKLLKRTLPLGLAGLMMAAAPLTALAGSPEFARTAEEWERLRDNVIEYDEIAALVHEYNATVQKDAIDYNEFRKEYGDTNDEVANKYRELADDLLSMDYPDVDDTNYASVMSAMISNEMTADDLNDKADDALEDSYVKRMTNLQTEANLVSSAQTEMINYYINQLQLQIDQKNQELLRESYRAAVTRRDVGMETDVAVLTAEENLRNMDQALINDQSAIETGRRKLQVLLGWKYDDTPEIREIPAVDMDRIASMNPAADKEQAVANNYTLLINKRQEENSRNADRKENLQTAVSENERNIGASLSASYQSVLAARTAYELAAAQAGLEEQNLRTADLQNSTGQLSRLEYMTQQNKTETARLQVEMAELKLFQAIQNYEWAVNGLASA